jgi:hypothetical protein
MRIMMQSRLGTLNCLLIKAMIVVDLTDPIPSFHVIRFQLYRLLVRLKCIFIPAQVVEAICFVDNCLCKIGRCLQHVIYVLDSFLELTGLEVHFGSECTIRERICMTATVNQMKILNSFQISTDKISAVAIDGLFFCICA